MKKKFPNKNTEDSLKKELEYCKQLLSIVKANKDICSCPKVQENIHYFDYTFLRNAFRTVLLDLLQQKLGPSFKPVNVLCYTEHKHGFYVYAKPNKCDRQTVIKYIGRYLERPVIATSRINHYDGRSLPSFQKG